MLLKAMDCTTKHSIVLGRPHRGGRAHRGCRTLYSEDFQDARVGPLRVVNRSGRRRAAWPRAPRWSAAGSAPAPSRNQRAVVRLAARLRLLAAAPSRSSSSKAEKSWSPFCRAEKQVDLVHPAAFLARAGSPTATPAGRAADIGARKRRPPYGDGGERRRELRRLIGPGWADVAGGHGIGGPAEIRMGWSARRRSVHQGTGRRTATRRDRRSAAAAPSRAASIAAGEPSSTERVTAELGREIVSRP